MPCDQVPLLYQDQVSLGQLFTGMALLRHIGSTSRFPLWALATNLTRHLSLPPDTSGTEGSVSSQGPCGSAQPTCGSVGWRAPVARLLVTVLPSGALSLPDAVVGGKQTLATSTKPK